MKTKILAVLSILVATSVLGETNTPPASLPIGSKEELNAYAVGLTSIGYISYGGNTVLQNSASKTFFQYNIGDIDDLLTALAGSQSSFDVANTADTINVYASVFDKNWQQLFWGNSNVLPEKVGTLWRPALSPVKMQLSSWIPIPFKGVMSALLIIRDSNGNVSDFRYLKASDGSISFESALAGWGTELLVTHDTGNGFATVAYSVPNKGQLIASTHLAGSEAVFIDNMATLKDTAYPAGAVINFTLLSGFLPDGSSAAPLLHLKLSQARQMNFSASAFSQIPGGSTAVKPTKVVVFQFSNSALNSRTEFLATNGTINITLPAGTYEVVPIYDGLFKNSLPAKPYYSTTTGDKG